MITDEEYIEATEINFFFKDLLAQANFYKPDDPFKFAQNYFQKMQSCMQIVGAEYNYIIESNHNRRSFVYCLIEAFLGFIEKDEITAIDFFHMIEAICPNFPRNIVLEAALAVDNITDISPIKYYFGDLSRAVYLHIIYDEWLKLMEVFIKEEVSTGSMQSSKLKLHVLEFSTSFPLSFYQPPTDLVNTAIDSIALYNAGQISFDEFRKAFCTNKCIALELYRITLNAATI